ncbi:MAG: Bud site selection protein bud4 [Vezdaea aestivalis]|nr:MAG: Bud site selection protein bud4 [Vezdaea aestivalis]
MPVQSAVQPLRIHKGTPSSSPTKSAVSPANRPLSEIKPGERRRNSPSFNQVTKKVMLADSSPFESSPFAPAGHNSSPRMFWQGRDNVSPTRISFENGHGNTGSPTSKKRSSIENLKRASRVKNSNMFAREQQHEYDPASAPINVERPLASGRPLTLHAQGNANGGLGLDTPPTTSKIPVLSPSKSPGKSSSGDSKSPSPSKHQISPTKSSMSNPGRFTAQPPKFDQESGMWSEDDSPADRQLPPGRTLHRHAKSVTFDVAPPQINEYEMTTPDLSSVNSGSREGSYDEFGEDESDRVGDDSFDASLEDIKKTPIVGPDDWRQASPRPVGLLGPDDPFMDEGSPMPSADPKSLSSGATTPFRTDSKDSSGERRPLPPLPGLTGDRFQSASPSHSSPIGELAPIEKRHLSSSPSISKADIQAMSGSKMSLEDRFQLMMLQESDERPDSPQAIRERKMRRAGLRSPDRDIKIKIHEDAVEVEDFADANEYHAPKRISRESILRRVKKQTAHTSEADDVDEYYSSPVPGSSPEHGSTFHLDPDTPIPSRELEYIQETTTQTRVIVKEEGIELAEEIEDLTEVSELYQATQLHEYSDDEESVIHHDQEQDDDDESHYSQNTHESEVYGNETIEDSGSVPTPRAQTPEPVKEAPRLSQEDSQVSLPVFSSMLGEDDFSELRSFMSPDPTPTASLSNRTEKVPRMSDLREMLQRPITPPDLAEPEVLAQEDREPTPQTPDSIVRHRLDSHSPPQESPSVPEPVATIKAPGGRLKTRPSMTPADMAAMAEVRRQVSGEMVPDIPAVPSIPARHRDRPSLSNGITEEDETEAGSPKTKSLVNRRKSLVKLDVPGAESHEDLSYGLTKEFDRLMEAKKVEYDLLLAQSYLRDRRNSSLRYSEKLNALNANVSRRPQRGYLMRQNTKVIVASSGAAEAALPTIDSKEAAIERGTRSAGNSPRKPSHDRTKSWSVEPWNGKMRRNSIKMAPQSPKKKQVPGTGSIPPLPGMESNAAPAGLESVSEDVALPDEEVPEIGTERGRLFVKVVGIKDMDLPLPKDEKTWFSLTLDNGLHCVTTSFLELGKKAPIGQEFELVVLDDLEFMLTLQAKVDKPAPLPRVESPTKTARTPKPSAFSRVFASPKKRKEMEKQQQEEERAARQRASDAYTRRPTAYDLLKNTVAQDERELGSFGRSYVCLKDYEANAFGRPFHVDIACFNEWATEEVTTFNNSSVKGNKRGGHGTQRKAPYKIGKIELQLLYIPKPKGGKDEEMPKSMNACVRELREAEAVATRVFEGHLSQQGGDCPYWRRRFFKLSGCKLTAYHETTRQPRATINLAKASKLIDDRSSLTKKDVSTKSGNRRKSAFAEEEEGYMFVEEGFRIRFANGEVIDFYADSTAEKDGWMQALDDTIGKGDDGKKGGWTALVLAKEAKLKSLSLPAAGQSPTKRHQRRTTDTSQIVPAPIEKDERLKGRGRNGAQPKSMIF